MGCDALLSQEMPHADQCSRYIMQDFGKETAIPLSQIKSDCPPKTDVQTGLPSQFWPLGLRLGFAQAVAPLQHAVASVILLSATQPAIVCNG